jgi:hAT family C-terminal dimerisation region
MDMMKAQHPQWILLGCQAHALALLIKDLHGDKNTRLPWSKKAYATGLMMSNTINGCEPVKRALREQQKELYGSVKGVRTHCPTRFAILHFIICDLLASEEAIRRMASARDWPTISGTTTHADEFAGAATMVPARGRTPAYRFFSEASALKVLVQPVSDAIHQLEADKALLSQLFPIWKQLLKHAANFDALPDNEGRAAVLPLFERRYELHRAKEWVAAYVVDPCYAVQIDGEWFLPFGSLEPMELAAAKACIRELGGAEHAAAITAELVRMQLAPLPEVMWESLPTLTERTTLASGKVQLASGTMRRGWWQTVARQHFPLVSEVAVKLLSFHATACATERNWSLWGTVYTKCRSNLALAKGEKLVFIKGNDTKAADVLDEEIMLELLEEGA